MKRIAIAFAVVVLAGLLLNQSAQAAQSNWLNIGIDFNTPANWSAGVPSGNNVAVFNLAPSAQPNLSTSISTAGLYFSGLTAVGYDITSSSAAIAFTLTGVGATGSGGSSNSNAAALRSEATSGTNTVDAPLILGAAAGATQVFYQEAGGTLIVNGAISSTNAVTLSFKGAGTIQLNGSNTFTSGSTIGQTNTTIAVGNDSALGSGTFSVGNSGTILASGGARTIANAVSLSGGTLTVGGSNAFTFGGPVTAAGAVTRTFTINNTATTTLQGNVFLSDVAGTGRTLVINGTGSVVINGVISNFNGAGTAGTLSHGGSGTLTLNNANTYSGGTLMSGGITIANADGAFGSGNVSLTGGTASLTLQGGITQNYIADTANFSIVAGAMANLNFVGTDVVAGLTLGGIAQAAGVYNATTNPTVFAGLGSITVIPEPATYMLFGVGLLICAQQFRRRRAASNNK